jgi:uncharacterized phage-like protein YoqJ
MESGNITTDVTAQTVCFTGHRPDKIGGYDYNNPTMQAIERELKREIENLIVNHGVFRFITGGALGVDTLAFKAVNKMKESYPNIMNILAVPFQSQDDVWGYRDKEIYKKMKELADDIIYVDTKKGYECKGSRIGQYHVAKMDLRNRYMVDNSKYCIAVWNGTSGGTCNCVKYARKCNREIIIIDPSKLSR